MQMDLYAPTDDTAAPPLDLQDHPSVEEVLARIRTESRDAAEKGRWFEQLFMRIVRQDPAFEVDEVWRWIDWPDRETHGFDGTDIGVDLVARRTTGEHVAIQCKCYDERHTLAKGKVDKFLAASQQPVFALRWLVVTCPVGPNARRALDAAHPPARRIDFARHLDTQIEAEDAARPVQEPWRLQREAIEHVVEGLEIHDRGRLVMACGTGKTFTSLRIAERLVPDDGRILFAAPTIALVSQARREWLRHTTRALASTVVCSDASAGGRGESEDIGTHELECPVSTDATEITRRLRAHTDRTHVVFCTYHSLRRVVEAQEMGAPHFDLAIADEAHRTTGAVRADRKTDFRTFHDAMLLHADKRLYMTATPRMYTERSKGSLRKRGFEVVDMGDPSVYGPALYHLAFSTAVAEGMLCDYRVIVLGTYRESLTPGLRRSLETHDGAERIDTSAMTRVLGVSLAVNGATEGTADERPGKLHRTLMFANRIERSQWYVEALGDREVKRTTTRRIRSGERAAEVVARHLDARDNAYARTRALRALATAGDRGECHVVSNVRLFTEGVDVPSLDAIAFVDPRESQVDVVQAVGRVMRRAPGKRLGYIIVPVVVDPGADVATALEKGTEGYRTIGRILRAIQSHDSRLIESLETYVRLDLARGEGGSGPGSDPGVGESTEAQDLQHVLDLEAAEQGIYAHVAAASGLGRPGQFVAEEIIDAVKAAAAVLESEKAHDALAPALEIVVEGKDGAKGVCAVGALLICNACLLQRRLKNEPGGESIVSLDKVTGAERPLERLADAWEAILDRDYAPVFTPALAALRALPETARTEDAIRGLAECANRVADSLSELGYDHAGPLYHRVLGSAKSDGAFYTNNVSALMLAHLALADDLVDWSDPEAVARLRIMDPACGTGTLLMAVLKTVKERVGAHVERDEAAHKALHKRLVEDVLCGLDVNPIAVQLAACNLTLGAPTVDYSRMNLITMPHGPQSDGTAKAGAIEILNTAEDERDLRTLAFPQRSLEQLDAEQVDTGRAIDFPLRDLDVVIMNAPFTDNAKRGRKFGPEALRAMQRNELHVRDTLMARDSTAAEVITTNSIRTFFTPLADEVLRTSRATLAKVVPTTACTGANGLSERRFLAERFHVEHVVTSHDPKRPNFSENTGIHESLLVCRRWPDGTPKPATQFVSLRRMPANADEALEAARAIASGRPDTWGTIHCWPAERVHTGDWSPAQWYDPNLLDICRELEANPVLEPLGVRHTVGPTGQAAQDSWRRCSEEEAAGDERAIRIFDTASAKVRRTLAGEPEQWVKPGGRRDHLWENVRKQGRRLLVTNRYNTISGRLTALHCETPTFGFAWMPVTTSSPDRSKALCAWLNSTPARLLLLNRRAKMLTYPKWSVTHWHEIPVPKPGAPSTDTLARAFEDVATHALETLQHADTDEARKVIDEAAARTLGVSNRTVADWRKRLAAEPTVTNERADHDCR